MCLYEYREEKWLVFQFLKDANSSFIFRKEKQVIGPKFDNYLFKIDKTIFVSKLKQIFWVTGRNGVGFQFSLKIMSHAFTRLVFTIYV